MMLDYYLISVIVFFVILGIGIWNDRKNIEHKYFIFYKRKTERGKKFIDSAVKISPTFWRNLGTVAVIVTFIAMVYGIYQIAFTIELAASGVITQPGIKLLLPTATANPSSGFGFIGIPFWFWIIIVAVLLIPHEFFHG